MSAVAALALHAWLLFGTGPLSGGADLPPHLRLAQLIGEAPALRNVYAPAFHASLALLSPVLGLPLAVKLVALLGAAALIGGFRLFQRAAGLPDAAAALFAWAPYGFALSWCLPKVEAGGYGIAFAGLALLLRRRPVGVALALAATFTVHTGAALFFGLCGGVLALHERDTRGLLALAAGTALAAPLLAVHVAAGCSPAEALLMSSGDYLRSTAGWSSAQLWERIVVLASPVALVCAGLGAAPLWRANRRVAVVGVVVLVLYTNELWLAPLGVRTTLNLLRGLTVFAFPVAAAAGVFLAASPRRALAGVTVCAVWAAGSTAFTLPGSCYRVPVDLEAVSSYEVDRCTFRWRRPVPGN